MTVNNVLYTNHKRHVAASKKYAPRVEKFDHVVQKIDHARSNLEQTFYHFTGFDSTRFLKRDSYACIYR